MHERDGDEMRCKWLVTDEVEGTVTVAQTAHTPFPVSAQPRFPSIFAFSLDLFIVSLISGVDRPLWWSPAAASSPLSLQLLLTCCTLCIEVSDHDFSRLRHTVHTTLSNNKNTSFLVPLSDAT